MAESRPTEELLNDPAASNAEKFARWPIDVGQDPYAIALEKFDPGHPALFEADTMWPYFARRFGVRVVVELKRIFEEMRAQGLRADARADTLAGRVDALAGRVDVLATEVRAQGNELRAVRDLLVDAVSRDHRRIDTLEVRVGALEAGKH